MEVAVRQRERRPPSSDRVRPIGRARDRRAGRAVRDEGVRTGRGQLTEVEQDISATQQRGLELKGEADRHESRIQFNEERLREIAAQNEKALTDISQAEERSMLAQAELDSLTQRLTASEAAMIEHRVQLEQKQTALRGVEATKFYPDWGKARLHGMIANRPDWTLSRARQWGVPMPFLVHKETGALHPRTLELLEQVAQRVEQSGIEAWQDLDPRELRDNLLPSLRWSGWSKDWYAGFPVMTFYFPLPLWTITLLGYVPGAFDGSLAGWVRRIPPSEAIGLGRLARRPEVVPAA